MNFSSLEGADRFKFDQLMAGYLNMAEATAFGNDILDNEDETMENWGYNLRERFLPYPGMLEWWAESQFLFSPEMRIWVNNEIEKTDMSGDFWKIK